MATIAERGHAPSGTDTVMWRWKDGEVNDHEYMIKNVLYFPKSPINILNVAELAKQLEDEEGIGIDTKQLRSRFYWDRNRYSLIILHPESNLPEMPINESYGI